MLIAKFLLKTWFPEHILVTILLPTTLIMILAYWVY